jgi:hypothetical protein
MGDALVQDISLRWRSLALTTHGDLAHYQDKE